MDMLIYKLKRCKQNYAIITLARLQFVLYTSVAWHLCKQVPEVSDKNGSRVYLTKPLYGLFKYLNDTK